VQARITRSIQASVGATRLSRQPLLIKTPAMSLRKALLANLLRGSNLSVVLNEHFEADGAIVYREACKLGCEGIVSKRIGSPYRSWTLGALGEG
jgi:hypothetical protein